MKKPIPELLCQFLTPHRTAIFDPCFGSSELIQAAKNMPLVSLYGLDPNQRSSAVRSMVGPANNSWPLIEKIQLRFDLTVCHPPDERWSATNLPVPQGLANAFGLSRRRSIVVESELHAVQATWLMMNRVLSPTGEGLIVAKRELAEQFIAKCSYAPRIWMWLDLPEASAIFFAADHRSTTPFERSEETDDSLAAMAPNWKQFRRTLIRGETVKAVDNNFALEVSRRFDGARTEQVRVEKGNEDFNVWMANGKIMFHVSEFQRLSGQVPRNVTIEGERLNRRSPIDLMALKDDRQLFGRIIQEKTLRVHPSMAEIYEETLSEYANARSPFTRPSVIQRIAWLDEHERVKCARTWEAFYAGETYVVSSCVFEGQRKERRYRPGHGDEDVLVNGQELMMILVDSRNRSHAFTQHELSTEERSKRPHIAGFHSLTQLIRNFELPDVPDIAETDRDTYREMMGRLEALETVN